MSIDVRILDRAQGRIPQPWRTIVDWLVTVGVAILVVLAFQAEVAKPYRIPSGSMEPTLHCAKPGAFCEGRFDDRVLANRLAYRFGNPERGQVVVFRAPETAERCGEGNGGTTFVKRIVGLPDGGGQFGPVGLDDIRALPQGLSQRFATGIEQRADAGLARHSDGTGIEIDRNLRRQRSAHHEHGGRWQMIRQPRQHLAGNPG